MKMRRMRSHPDFKLEGRSRHFQSFWELELIPGERTHQHQHYESEEIIYLVSGEGQVTIAEKERAVVPGEVVLVPPRTSHVIANASNRLVRAITVESRFDLGLSEKEEIAGEDSEEAREEARKSAGTIDELLGALPEHLDEATALKSMVDLFNIGGSLSEHVEESIGLENAGAIAAIEEIERKIMLAVVDITGRYLRRGGRLTG